MSHELIKQMFKHLIKVYTEAQTVEILSTKFPDSAEFINAIDVDTLEDVNDEPKSYKTPKPPKPVKEKTVKKQDRAQELYDNAVDKSRQAMLKVFVDDMGVSEASASNYYHLCKRATK